MVSFGLLIAGAIGVFLGALLIGAQEGGIVGLMMGVIFIIMGIFSFFLGLRKY